MLRPYISYNSSTGGGKKLIMDRQVRIGRFKAVHDQTNQFFIRIALDDACVSTNHALIDRLPGENVFKITDLDSLNGTFINGVKRDKAYLLHGDKIGIGGKILTFTLEAEKTYSRVHALLAGCPGTFPRLKGIENDLKTMSHALNPHTNNISVLYDDKASKSDIFRVMKNYQLTFDDALFIFFYAGHGSTRGLCTGFFDLTPKELYNELAKIRGFRLVILDSCHSSIFQSEMPDNTLLLSGESPSGHMYEGGVTCLAGANNHYSPYVFQQPVQGFLTRAIVKYLEEHAGDKIDFKRLPAELMNYRLAMHNIQLFANGVTIQL